MKLNLICASHKPEVLRKNLGSSLFYKDQYSLLLTRYSNVAAAYNVGTELLKHQVYDREYFIYIHHDVFLPAKFEEQVIKAVTEINERDPDWGVLGVYGADYKEGKRIFFGRVRDRGHDVGTAKGLPVEVQTLDELLLITKGDLKFDEQFEQHFYGADICTQAKAMGRKSYVIDAYVHHNSSLVMGKYPESFFEAKEKFKEKWKLILPINMPCALITN